MIRALRMGLAAAIALLVVMVVMVAAVQAFGDTTRGADDCVGGTRTFSTLRHFVVCEDAHHDAAQAALTRRVTVLDTQVTDLTNQVSALEEWQFHAQQSINCLAGAEYYAISPSGGTALCNPDDEDNGHGHGQG